jgi:hypothetical protein
MGRLICQSCGKVLEHDYPVDGDSHGTCVPCGRMLYPMVDWDKIEREMAEPAPSASRRVAESLSALA